jgi:hypothetical protein
MHLSLSLDRPEVFRQTRQHPRTRFPSWFAPFIVAFRQANPVARIDELDPELLERLAPKASLASGEAADGCEAWHQTSADFHAFDPTAFD